MHVHCAPPIQTFVDLVWNKQYMIEIVKRGAVVSKRFGKWCVLRINGNETQSRIVSAIILTKPSFLNWDGILLIRLIESKSALNNISFAKEYFENILFDIQRASYAWAELTYQ